MYRSGQISSTLFSLPHAHTKINPYISAIPAQVIASIVTPWMDHISIKSNKSIKYSMMKMQDGACQLSLGWMECSSTGRDLKKNRGYKSIGCDLKKIRHIYIENYASPRVKDFSKNYFTRQHRLCSLSSNSNLMGFLRF